MKKQFLFLLPLFFILLHCSFSAEEAIMPVPAQEPKIKSVEMKIRKSQVLELQVEDFKPGLEATEYRWEASNGLILSQSGKNAAYQAPEKEGHYEIHCQSFFNENLLGTTIFKIWVYPQIVILKADDLIYEGESIFPNNWNRYFELIESMGIKGSAGIIGNSLENAPETYFQKIKDHHQRGHIEFWNHGYSHLLGGVNEKGEVYHEFNNSGFEFQKHNLERTQTLGKEKLGITFRSFGAPGNQIDENTKRLIEANSDIRLWFYGHTESQKNVLKRTKCEIEFPSHHPSFNKFQASYQADVSFLVLQFHPTKWTEIQFEEFRMIIQFLYDQKVLFMNPAEMAKEFYPELLEGAEEFPSIL